MAWDLSPDRIEEAQLSRISSGGFLPDGRFYLVDALRRDVLLFDPSRDGVFEVVGRAGAGPGEFQRVSMVRPTLEGLEVFDSLQGLLHRFDREGVIIDAIRAPPVLSVSVFARQFDDGSWLLVQPASRSSGEGATPTRLIHVKPDGVSATTIDTIPRGFALWSSKDGSFGIVSPDLGEGGGFAVSGDSIIVANGLTGRISMYSKRPGAGGAFEQIAERFLGIEPHEISPEFAASLEAATIEQLRGSRRPQRRVRLDLPPHLSGITALRFDRTKRLLWLRSRIEVPGGAPSRRWQVVNLNGEVVEEVELPSGMTILALSEDLILVTKAGELGVPEVSILRVTR